MASTTTMFLTTLLLATACVVQEVHSFVPPFLPHSTSSSTLLAEKSTNSKSPTLKQDESASDATSMDNPPPGVKFIECPEDEVDMPFYTLGVNLAMQVGGDLGTLLTDRECDLVAKGLAEHLKGTLTKQGLDGQTILQNFGPAANAMLQERTQEQAAETKQAGQDYIATFLKEHPKAEQSDTGLVYLEQSAGTNNIQPTIDSNIEFHYHGTIAVDGKVVDSSVVRGQPHIIPLSQAIAGLKEGLLRMTEGTKATLVIPSDLAYGDAGSGQGIIPGGSTLQFEVELIRVIQDNNDKPNNNNLPAADSDNDDDDEPWNA